MTKRVVDDAMVERARKAFRWPRTGDAAWSAEILAREMLEAALTEPEEIPVTEEMLGAGYEAYHLRPGSPAAWDCLRDAYRAMAAMDPARRKSEKAVPSWDSGYWMHLRAGETIPKCHRRKDDPR